jgi:polar amino acid transport system substrate-binding protein
VYPADDHSAVFQRPVVLHFLHLEVNSMRPLRPLGAIALGAVLVLGGCNSSSSSPSAASSGSPRSSATASSTTTSSATAGQSSAPVSAAPSATAGASALATVPADQLSLAGKLLICSDLPYPPQEFFDDQGNPIGSDIEIGQEIARRLGLQPQIVNSVFDTIIPALVAGKCDIIISAQNITAARKKQVDMITYFQAGQSFLVAKGNPQNIKTQQDLCGKAIAAETGTTEVDYLNGTGDYTGQGLSAQCTKAGQAKISVKTFPKDSDALLALQGGQVDAYFADSPVAGYYVVQHPDAFELSGLTLGVAKEGISVAKDHTDLEAAVRKALSSMVNDGTYLKILQKYGVDTGNAFAK